MASFRRLPKLDRNHHYEGLLVTRLENLLPDMEINWKVWQLCLIEIKKAEILLQVVTADRHLQLFIYLSVDTGKQNPFRIISTALDCVFLRKCLGKGPHDDGSPDANAVYVTPLWNKTVQSKDQEKTPVVAVKGNEELRLFSVTCGAPGVISMEAYPKCCLKLCSSNEKV